MLHVNGLGRHLVLSVSGFILLVVRVHGEAATNSTSRAEVTLPAMVVTATRDARVLTDTPYSVSLLDDDAWRIGTPARTVPEALRFEPSTMVQKTSQGQGSPYIRGFTGYRNLFLIDGIRLNNSVFRDGPNQYWNTVDALGLSRLEVVRGPASMLYGSDAIGGTVQVVTRGSQDLRPDSDWDRRLYYRYSSADNANIARAESIGRLTDRLALTLGYSFKDFGNVEGGRDVGKQEKTGYDEHDWDAKLEYMLTPNAILVVAHQNVDLNDAWRTHKTIYGIDWEGLTVGNELRRVLDQDRDLTTMQLHQVNGNGFADEIHAGISHQVQSEFQDRLRTGDRHDEQGFDVNTLGAFLTLKSASPVGSLVYGSEFYHDNVDSFARTLNPDGSVKSESIQGPVADEATYDVWGVFLQDEIPLTERLSCVLGGRYEAARADADVVEDPATGEPMSVSGDWDDVVGSLRMLCALDAQRAWTVFSGVSQGFRAPNLSDLTRFDSARTDEIETPSPDLDPEHFITYEIGMKAGTRDLQAQAAYYYTDIDGMIVRTPTGRIIDDAYEVTKKNAGNGYIHGVELDARYRFQPALTAFGTFTWMDGEVETYPTSEAVLVTEPIDRLMPRTGRFGLRWDRHQTYWIEASCTIAAKADKLSTQDEADTSRIPPGGTPGYTVYDLRAGWNVSDDLKLSLAVENITDEDYRIHGSGVNEPGRNLLLAADWTF